jgi:Protein of unknown function (DUF2911)
MRAVSFLAVCLALTGPVLVAAQAPVAVNLPASPRGLAAIQVGGEWTSTPDGRQYRNGKWITIDYGRPILRGRENIFGVGAEYGRTLSDGSPVWRAGANNTTQLTTQVALQIGGTTVQPGSYSVMVDLTGGAWTLVLSTQPVQAKYDPADKVNLYGSYNYDRKFDVLRAPMLVDSAPVSFEQFTIDFVDVGPTGGTLLMVWDRTVAMVPFTVR